MLTVQEDLMLAVQADLMLAVQADLMLAVQADLMLTVQADLIYIVTNKVTLWAASYSACVVSTITMGSKDEIYTIYNWL